MKGQTALDPCRFCGEPSIAEMEITPAVIKKGEIEREALRAPVCATHREHVQEQRGWQDRAAKRRADERRKWARERETTRLFDGDEGAPTGWAA